MVAMLNFDEVYILKYKTCHYHYILYMYTSAKIIQLNVWRCRDEMHYAKNRGNKEIPLAILSRILAQSCVTPLPELRREGLRMIVLVSLIVL